MYINWPKQDLIWYVILGKSNALITDFARQKDVKKEQNDHCEFSTYVGD